jgi:hypothetical protein
MAHRYWDSRSQYFEIFHRNGTDLLKAFNFKIIKVALAHPAASRLSDNYHQ